MLHIDRLSQQERETAVPPVCWGNSTRPAKPSRNQGPTQARIVESRVAKNANRGKKERSPRARRTTRQNGGYKNGTLVDRGGVEPPTHGFSVRPLDDASPDSENKLGDGSSSACTPACTDARHSVASAAQPDPDVARIVAAWPSLPEPIKRAMLALVGAW